MQNKLHVSIKEQGKKIAVISYCHTDIRITRGLEHFHNTLPKQNTVERNPSLQWFPNQRKPTEDSVRIIKHPHAINEVNIAIKRHAAAF